jgi:YYY domain-containing protein
MEYALVARWLVLYLALFALGLPLVARLLPRSTGRGAGLAVPAALVVLSVPAYWVGQVTWGPLALAAGVLTLLAASALAGLDLAALRRGRVRLAVDIDRDAVGDAAAVFLLGFAFVVAVRAFDPAVYPIGGEKFLDFGLLQTLDRSTVLPPEDFWFANEPVKYYYGGHLTATLLAWLTATPLEFAYNLALAGFYAALVTAAFELAGAVSADRVRSGAIAGGRLSDPRSRRRIAGAIAVFFVGFASNLVTAGRFALLALPEPLRRGTAELVAARTGYTVERILAGAGSFSYWSASRVIPDTINEFPLFAWLNGDLHAHMMGTPALLLAAAVGYAYYRTPESDLRRRRLLLVAVLPVLAAWQAVQSTWSFPSVLALGWLAAVFAPADPRTLLPAQERLRRTRPIRRLRAAASGVGDRGDPSESSPTSAATRELGRVAAALLVAAIATVLAGLLASPFLLGAAAGGGERSIELLGPEMRSGLGALLLVHGAFVVGLGAWLCSQIRIERPWFLLGALAAVAVVGTQIGFAALAVSVPLLLLAWVGLRTADSIGYGAVLVVAGAGLATIVELVYVNEQAGPGRMNTVFKTYSQVWVFWGTAMGVALADLLSGVAASGSASLSASDSSAADGTAARGVPWRRVATVALVIALVASTGVYGVLAVGSHFDRAAAGGPTLDATRFVETDHPEYAEAIEWVDEREGRPTLLEAPGTSRYDGGNDGRPNVMYSWYANPASSLTGVPTVAGWQHEVGYRGQAAYAERVRDVDAMYTGNASERARLLRQYEVEYIWVGPGERARYGSLSFGTDAIDVAHRSGDVTIYAVDRAALDAPASDE